MRLPTFHGCNLLQPGNKDLHRQPELPRPNTAPFISYTSKRWFCLCLDTRPFALKSASHLAVKLWDSFPARRSTNWCWWIAAVDARSSDWNVQNSVPHFWPPQPRASAPEAAIPSFLAAAARTRVSLCFWAVSDPPFADTQIHPNISNIWGFRFPLPLGVGWPPVI